MYDQRKEQILFAISAFLLLLLYGAGLFFNVTGDAAKYAYIAKNMVNTNDWLILKIQGQPYWQKPQFLFWLSALSFKFLGVSNFTFKLPIFLYSLLGFWATYRLGKSLFDQRIGMMAATMLAFSVISVLYNSDIHTDIVLQTNVILSTWLMYEFVKSRKILFLVGGAFTVGLSILTKGPFGAMVPFFAVLGYSISQKKYKLLYSPVWLLFFAIVGATILPVLIPLIQNEGTKGLWFFIWQNNIGRVTGSYMGTNSDPLYYIHSLAYMLLPWSIVVGAGIYLQFKKFINKQLLAQEHYLFWGTWIVFLLLSIAKSKLQNYAQVLVPLLFILTANAWQHYFMRKKNPWKKAHQILIYGLWAFIIVAPLLLNVKKGIPYSLVLIVCMVAAILATKSLLPSKKLYFSTIILMVGVAFTLNAYLLPRLLRVQAERSASKLLLSEIQEGEKVYNYNLLSIERKQEALKKKASEKITSFDKTPNLKHFYLNYELMFYCNNTVVQVENQEQLNQILSDEGAWIFSDPKGKNDIYQKSKNIDAIYALDHFNLRSPARSIDWEKRQIDFEKMYLIHLKP